MEGFAATVRDELTAAPPPRKVGLRAIGDCWRQWAMVLFFTAFAFFLGFTGLKIWVDNLAVGNGIPATAQVSDHSTLVGRRGETYYLHVAFQDLQGRQRFSTIRVDRQAFDANPNGAFIALHYLPWFAQWPVWDQDPPDPHSAYGAGLITLMSAFCLLFSVSFLGREFYYFRDGLFVEGTVADVLEKGERYEVVRVKYLLNGERRQMAIRRRASDSTLNNAVALVVMPGKPESIRIYLNNSDGSLFRAKAPGSFDSR
jgi:hypothetical protein